MLLCIAALIEDRRAGDGVEAAGQYAQRLALGVQIERRKALPGRGRLPGHLIERGLCVGLSYATQVKLRAFMIWGAICLA